MAVLTHAISVRSCASRVRSIASFVDVDSSSSGDAAIGAPFSQLSATLGGRIATQICSASTLPSANPQTAKTVDWTADHKIRDDGEKKRHIDRFDGIKTPEHDQLLPKVSTL